MGERYWVGNGGNWDSTAHWSLTSGGANGAAEPTTADNVHFDANSFTSASQIVTFTGLAHAARARNLDFTNVANTPTISMTSSMELAGDLTLVSGMVWNCSGPLVLEGASTCNMTSAGKLFEYICGHSGQTGMVLSLLDDLRVRRIGSVETINTNGHALTCREWWYNKLINLGASIVTVTRSDFSGSNVPYLAFRDAGVLNGGTGGFVMDSDTLFECYYTSGQITLGGTAWTIVKAAGSTVAFNHCTLSNVTVSGGATFEASTSNGNIDGGGTVGLGFAEQISIPLATVAVTAALPFIDGSTQSFIQRTGVLVHALAPLVIWSLTLAMLQGAVTIYRCRLTGQNDGLDDLVLPMSSFQARLRDGEPSYLTCVIPAGGNYALGIGERPGGDIVIQKGYRLQDGSEALQEIARVNYESLSIDRGARNESLTLTGHKTVSSTVAAERTMTGLSYFSQNKSGYRRVRADLDLFLRPGDVCIYGDGGNDWFNVSQISYTVSAKPASAVMEVSES